MNPNQTKEAKAKARAEEEAEMQNAVETMLNGWVSVRSVVGETDSLQEMQESAYQHVLRLYNSNEDVGVEEIQGIMGDLFGSMNTYAKDGGIDLQLPTSSAQVPKPSKKQAQFPEPSKKT